MILLVEDNATSRWATTKLLRDRGYEVRDVGTFVEAVDALHEHIPTVLVLDLMLPCGRTGLELLEQCSKLPGYEKMHTIVATGLPPWMKQNPAGCEVLEKPFHIEALVKYLEQYKEQHLDPKV